MVRVARVGVGGVGCERAVWARGVDEREARFECRRDTEHRVAHPERAEECPLQIVGVRHPGEDFDQPRLHVVAEAVDPPFARIVEQWHGGQLVHLLSQRVELAHAETCLAIQRINRALSEPRCQSKRVPERVLDRRLARRRGQDRVAAGIRAFVDLHVRKLRQVAVQRIGEPELALFVEGQQSDAGDRLRHGVEAEQRVGPHRFARRQVGNAERLLIHDLATPGDRNHDPRQPPRRDVGLDRRVEPRQTRRGHPDAFRRRGWQIGRRERHRAERGHGDQQGHSPER